MSPDDDDDDDIVCMSRVVVIAARDHIAAQFTRDFGRGAFGVRVEG